MQAGLDRWGNAVLVVDNLNHSVVPSALKCFRLCAVLCLQVSKGKDLFLIRWEAFGPYWDSWEGRSCLNAAPHTYAWQGGKPAIPAKFKA